MQGHQLRTQLASALWAVLLTASPLSEARKPPSGKLEIHYINVEQGGGTLIVGPNGTTIMYDFGNLPGGLNVGEYLRQVLEMAPGDTIDYAMVSHGDKDHYMGYKNFVEKQRFDVAIANYEPGTDKAITPTMRTYWLEPAKNTRAGAFQPIHVGLRIALGDGAEAHVVAANGLVLGEPPPLKPRRIRNENDRSIALFIRYGKFTYILDGDLGGGPDKCTGHDTTQIDVQSRVAVALVKNDLLAKDKGITVMHVAHHGSESSTPSTYYNAIKPQVAAMSVGKNQQLFLHPRVDVVEKILLQSEAVTCKLAAPVKEVFQTSEGPKRPCAKTGCMSHKGLVSGSFVISTDGKKTYQVKTEKAIRESKNMAPDPPHLLDWTFALP